MRITLQYASQKFQEFNQLIFQGRLPGITIKISNSRRTLGMFVHPRKSPLPGIRNRGECSLRFSSRLDLPQEDIEDTIIHEMIHYYIWYNRESDSGPHGFLFKKYMNQINLKFNRHITITHKSTSAELNSDTHSRNNYICITHWNKGFRGVTICAKTKIFEIHRIYSSHPDIFKIEWFWSRSPWFNKYPVSRTAKVYSITSIPDFESNLSTATPCEIQGNIFRPVMAPKHQHH